MKTPDKKQANHPGYETTDVHARPILYFLLITLAVLIITGFIIGGLYALLEQHDAKNQTLSTVFSNQPLAKPEVILEPTPSALLQKHNGEQQKLMTSYEWVDPEKQIIRMPVEVAMKNLLRQSEAAQIEEPRAR